MQRRGRSILVGGGVRCGKSAFALSLARSLGARRLFIATADCFDAEMQLRAERHRAERGTEFDTREVPHQLCEALGALPEVDVVVVDCLTLWLSNLLLSGKTEAAVLAEVDHLCAVLGGSPFHVVMVTNEVGMGIVPEHALARTFRDVCGRAHQRIGHVCDEVYFGALGQLLRLKPGAVEVVAPS